MKLNSPISLVEMFKKCLKRNIKYIFSKNILHEMSGSVLCNTSESIFYFYGRVIDEVLEYCRGIGYNIDKIIFVTSYDLDVMETKKEYVRMHADSKIEIIKEDNYLVAVVFMGDSISFHRD